MGFMKFDAIPEAKYLCDTIEDLSTLLPRPSYGDTCWVISEACEYICNSKGEWLPKEKASKTTANVDLTGYATEDFVQEQIQNIEHPTVEVPSKLSELENDANYAQQAYVDAKVADLVNSAPETLDTIGEIAQALKDHQDVADAITEAIGKKADKEDLPSIEGLASESFVTEAIQKIEFPVTDLSNYYTREEVTQAIIDNAELPEGGLAHQHLTIDAEGNKVWEDRSHWMEEQEDYLVNTSGNGKYISYLGLHNLKPNKEYTIIHNDTEYKCISQEINGIAVLGNLKYMNPSYEDTGEPFFFPGVEKDLITFYAMFAEEGEHTFSVFGPVDIAKPLSELYMPQSVPVVKLASAKGQAVVVGDVKNGHPTSWTTATIPTKVSELENDAKHATEKYVDDAIANIEHPLPEVDKVHQVLTTNENGEKVWEDKLCYNYRVNYEVYAETTIPEGKGGIMPEVDVIEPIVKNESYIVTWDGVEYPCVAYAREGSDFGTVLGNEYLAYTDQPELDNGLPFLFIGFYAHEVMKLVYAADKNGHVFSVRGSKQTNTVIPGQYIAGGVYAGTGSQSTVIGDPLVAAAPGNGSVSLGGIADGVSAVAEGNGTTHSDSQCAHAEGSFTHAHGWVSHVEGYGNTAYRMQHVQGCKAVEDPNSIYADIVGNGSQDGGDRSNAYALDWHGNAYFDGDVFVQGDGKTLNFDGAKKVATEEYVGTKVAELVDNAPETLNTLKEVADALNENASTVEALNQAIGNKVNKTDYPIAANPNQVLVTNDKGEKTWEEKLAYTTAETIPFLEEFTWDGTQTSFPMAITDANDGDAVTIYIDDIPYTGVLQDDFFTSWLVKFDEEYDNPWIKAMDQFHISKKGYNMNIGGAPLTWAVGKLSATVNTNVVHPIDNKYLGLRIKNGSEENSMIINGDTDAIGYGALSINSGRASGTYSVALGDSSASGSYAFAATGGSAKATHSAAFGDWTDAVTDNSVTIGTHNITDENKEYLFIVGNGEKGEFNPQTGYQRTLSNAHTVNKDGTGWFQKEIKVGGTSEHDENAKKVATEEYVNSLLENKADSADIVQANWDENSSESNAYVMNRPFYDSRTNVIEWDGETSDTIVTIPKMNVTLYRVSDTPLTKDELGMVTYYEFDNPKSYTNLNSDLMVLSDGKIISADQTFHFMSVLEDGVTFHVGNGVEDVVFEKKGIYFWELKFTATISVKTQKIKYGTVTQIPDYYISDKIARQDEVRWIDYSTPKTFLIYAAHLDQDVITEVHSSGYIAGTGKNYTNNLSDALSYDDIKEYFNYAPNWAKTINIAWHPSEDVLEKRQAIDLHLGEDGIGFHFIKDITFDETTGQPKFNLKKVWIANPNYVAE